MRSAALLVLALPSIATAQTVRGSAVERSGTAPVAGVVTLLLDTADRIVARALTNERGEYRLAAPSAGTYRVRTQRIGFRPLISLPFELSQGQDLQQSLVLSSVPVSLDTVRVVSRSVCRVLSDSTGSIAAVWEQARTALTAAQLTAGARVIKATIARSYRTLDPTLKKTVYESVVVDTNFVSKPWRSRPADSLRLAGYVTEHADGSRSYHAPDLDVLLSVVFIEDHCFRLANARNAQELIGLAFEPTRERSKIPEIRGTLWLDRASAALRRMEFTYVNAVRTPGIDDAGGDMEFTPMASGAWAISSWTIRMPVLEQRTVADAGIPSSRPTTELRLRGWQIAGGELRLVTRGADTLWSRPSAAVVATAPTLPRPAVSAAPSAPAPPATRDTGLALVPVEVRASRPMLTEFDERRLTAGGIGHFLTREQLAKQEHRALPDILVQLPGVRIAREGGKTWVTSGRGMVTSLNEKRPISPRFESSSRSACYAMVYVDGLMLYGGRKDQTFFDISTIQPADIEGIEYYGSPAQTPVKYSQPGVTTCGTLLIWTRRP